MLCILAIRAILARAASVLPRQSPSYRKKAESKRRSKAQERTRGVVKSQAAVRDSRGEGLRTNLSPLNSMIRLPRYLYSIQTHNQRHADSPRLLQETATQKA